MSKVSAWMHGGVLPGGGVGRHVILSIPGGVTVPLGFSGIQNASWPATHVAGPAAPKIPLSMSARERNHDIAGYCSQWRDIHTAAGVFNATSVARLDTWINQAVTDGREIIFTIFGTPTWAASTSINFTDQYGTLYGANAPADIGVSGSANLAAFVTWLVTRYNTGSRKIQYIEAWNEPLFSTAASSYWTGTYVQMAQVMKTVYQAAKAVDSGIKVLSPGFAGMSGGLSPMVQNTMTAAVGDATTGLSWCDGVAFHAYDFGLARAGFYPICDALKQFISDVVAYAPGKPIYNSEAGFLHDWTGVTQAERARIIKQAALVQAALGIKFVQWYGADYGYVVSGAVSAGYVASNIIGGPLTDQTIRDAFIWVAALSGTTIYEVGMLGSSAMYAQTAAGVLLC